MWCGAAIAQITPHYGWDQTGDNETLPSPYDWETNASIRATIWFDGIQQNRTDIEVAAFVGDEIRGDNFIYYDNAIDSYYLELQISYDEEGETAHFKIFDHSTQTEYLPETTYVITEDGLGPNDDFRLEITTDTPVEPEVPAYPWIPTSSYSDNITVVARILINGFPVTTVNWELGVFCNGECRGRIPKLSNTSNYGILAFPAVRGVVGDEFNFYLYDTQNSQVHPGICETTVTWLSGQDSYGTPADPVILNFVYENSYEKEIIGYNDENDHYYLIATPIYDEEGIAPSSVLNMLENEYDLYYFNQSAADGLEWINFKDSNDGNFNMISGKGYLYANSETVTLKFTGAPYTGDGKVTLYKDDNAEFPGWNLVGNPFPQTAYITKPFYTMGENGEDVIAADINNDSVAAMEGVFVIAGQNEEIMTFSTEKPSGKISQMVLNISGKKGNTIDRAIISFNTDNMLPKFQLNENHTRLYIPQNNKSFAMVNADKNAEEMPLNFKADENGTYTLSLSKEYVDMQYLRLIDHKTGATVDLLANPVYTFDATTTDYSNRFVLQFKANSNVSSNETVNPIQYLQNGQLTIVGMDSECELQVIDMLGRIISSTKINGEYSKMLTNNPGVYMIRLISNDKTYTQKIVVD